MAIIRNASGKSSSSNRRVKVPGIREVYLSLREVEDYIRKFEEKYKISSADFLRNGERHNGISEDDAFEWEAFVEHRLDLLLLDEQTRRDYLSTVRRVPRKSRTFCDSLEQASFAA